MRRLLFILNVPHLRKIQAHDGLEVHALFIIKLVEVIELSQYRGSVSLMVQQLRQLVLGLDQAQVVQGYHDVHGVDEVVVGEGQHLLGELCELAAVEQGLQKLQHFLWVFQVSVV